MTGWVLPLTACWTCSAPMGGSIYRIENTIAKPWIVGYKKDSFRSQPWRFIDIAKGRTGGTN